MSDQRFEAAKAAMQGVIAADVGDALPFEGIAKRAVLSADALLAELARTAPQPEQKAPQGSASDALLMARFKAAEAVCGYLNDRAWAGNLAILMKSWSAAKAAHEAQGVSHE